MNNLFEQEMRKLFGDGEIIQSPTFSGRICMGTLGRDLRVRAQFISSGITDQYDAIQLTVLNCTGGPVDTLTLGLKELLGRLPVPGNPNFPKGVAPHIWHIDGKLEWYAACPSQKDYETIRQAAAQYLDAFRERTQEQHHDNPKLVYICASALDSPEKNIAFAQQKSNEVMQDGNTPVCCPRLLFPPDPGQDQATHDMGLRLLDFCHQVNVYGAEWTEDMWAEIRRAMERGIPVMTDQKTIGRSQPARKPPRKGRGER